MKFSRTPLLAALLAALLAPTILAGAALAAEPPAQVDFEGSPITFEGDDVWVAELVGMKHAERLSLYVHLESPSVMQVADAVMVNRGLSSTDAIGGSTLLAVHNEVVDRQQATVDAVAAMGGTVISQMQVTLNAIHVEIARSQLAELASLPGVKSISRAPEHFLAMDDSRPHIGATQAAEELGLDGEGTVVAIIDTGIDYMHAGLGGHGDTEIRGNDDNTIIEDGSFPTDKVLGGYDFVGQAYNAGAGTPPIPDEDPIDENGHGSHVAGITAGLPTTGAASLDMSNGVAPAANLVALKVFGQSGSTNVTVEAMDWVAMHNMYLGEENENIPGTRPEVKIDVINMSLGGSFGGGMAEYIAVTDRLIEQGVTVVASAGNSGATPYIVGSPSATPKILSVANSFAPGELAMSVLAEWDDQSEEYGGVEAANWAVQLLGTGAASGDLAYFGTACNGETPEQEVNEKIALIMRGGCAFYDKVNNAATEGAIAALVYNNVSGAPIPMGCGAPSPCGTQIGIPAVMIDFDNGDKLRKMLVEDGTAITVTMDAEKVVELDYLADVMADSSSRGPGRAYTHIKPQITAPGSNIISARNGSGNDGVRLSGTSMSGPAVAGVTALLWQRNNEQDLGLSADSIAALAMNYSTPVIKRNSNQTGPTEGVTRQGAGLTNAYRSAVGMTLVRSDEGIAELSFGATDVATEAMEYERTLTVYNLSDEAKTYSLDYEYAFPDDDADAGVSLSFDAGDSLTVEGGEMAEVVVTLSLDPESARDWQAHGLNPMTNEDAFQLYEVDGYIHLTEVDENGDAVEEGDMVGVPWHTLPRLRGCTTPDSTEPFTMASPEDDFEVEWANECGGDTEVQLFWLAAEDDLESVDADMPAELDAGAVGVRYGMADVSVAENTIVDTIEFTVVTAGGRSIPSNADVNVFVDPEKDGEFNFVVWNVQLGNPALAWGAVWAPVAQDGNGPTSDQNQWSLAFYMNHDFHDSSMTMAIPVQAFGEDVSLDAGDLSFEYAVVVREGQGDYSVDEDDSLEDMVPNDMADGGRLTFDQAVLECLTLTNDEGESLVNSPNTKMPLESNGTMLATVGYTCDPMMEDDAAIPVGILGNYINNMPGTTAWSVRPGSLQVPGEIEPTPTPEPQGIYLPWLANNFEPEEE